MLDLELIDETIDELEHSEISFDNCNKLASLYICREYNKNRNTSVKPTQNEVSHDSNTILSSYYKYVDAKKRYQQFEVADKMLVYAMENLCNDLTDLISDLYHNTETQAERALIVEMANRLRSVL